VESGNPRPGLRFHAQADREKNAERMLIVEQDVGGSGLYGPLASCIPDGLYST